MAIWNTMMGTSLLAVPWAIEHSGFATGLSIIFAMTIMAYYTAFIIIDSFNKHNSKCVKILIFYFVAHERSRRQEQARGQS